jgi:membrane-associated phospholipid phosphatase
MGLWHFGATTLDRSVAKTVARYTSPALERPARVMTWAADEHVLGVIAVGLWLAARAGNERERRHTEHLALSIVVTAILPHVLKRLIDQKRPDRCMVYGPRRGIPRSGKPYDAFPSGHAMHVGAVASAVSWAYPKSAPVAWGLGALIAATRIVILAHWTTDVLAGLAMGALVERWVRPRSKRRTSEHGGPQTPAWRSSSPRSTVSSKHAFCQKSYPVCEPKAWV